MLFFNRWTAGVGEFLQTVRLIAPDQVTELSKAEAKFALGEPAAHAINVAVFGNVTFNVAGVYFVEVLVDSVMKIRYPLPVVVVAPPNANPPPPPKAGP
jgi:type IV secretory pathway TrbF-like protein